MGDIIQSVKREKKVGLLIHDKAQIFSSGMIQNAYFIYVCFEKLGMKCQFLCYESDPSAFNFKNISVKQISEDSTIFDPNEYHTIITITCGVSKEMKVILKKHKIAIVAFICGNHYMHDQEDFVKGQSGTASTFIGKSIVDELWVIPCYQHSLEYLEVIRGRPAFNVPHVWSPEIIHNVALSKGFTDLYYDITKHTSPTIEIVILEPNLCFAKTAWLPIVVAEKLNMLNPDLVKHVFAFNFPDNKKAWAMADNFSLGPKLRRFKRMSMPEILTHFNRSNSIPIFVSHQVMNSLNYIYYELLYYGFPLVHNSPDLDGCGYFYPDCNIGKCIEAILHAFKHHHKSIETYKAKAMKYLERVDPFDPKVASTWDQMVNDVLNKSLHE
jgi:hypothetical protein